MAAFTAHVNIAMVIVVDPDVNIYDPADVLWALVNRVDWGEISLWCPARKAMRWTHRDETRGADKAGIARGGGGVAKKKRIVTTTNKPAPAPIMRERIRSQSGFKRLFGLN
jgi:hypothetical protein